MRSTLMAIPMPLLIGINALRVLGVLFLLLAATGRLSGPFPFSAGLGSIITGAFAIPLALSVARSQRPRWVRSCFGIFLGHSTSLPPLGSASPQQPEAHYS